MKVAKALRVPAGVAAPEEAFVRFDSRAPAPEGDGFYALAVGEAVLVFADGFEAAYPRELMHGPPAVLAAQVKTLRDFVAAMDEGTMRLHGLLPATRVVAGAALRPGTPRPCRSRRPSGTSPRRVKALRLAIS